MAEYRIKPKPFLEYLSNLTPKQRSDNIMKIALAMVEGKTSSAKWLTRIAPSKKSNGDYTEEFLAFWEEYPKKTGKGAAFAVWQSLCIQETPVKLLHGVREALKWQKHSKGWVDGFVPLPETYLRQRRFDDEPETISKSKISKVY